MQVRSSSSYPNTEHLHARSLAPHIGHLHSLVIADIFARHAKLSDPDREVHFVTGTDEHGLKIQNAAKARGMEPLAFCDELSEHFRVRFEPLLHCMLIESATTKAEPYSQG